MVDYYVRKTGSDANAGTSAGAAWLTIGKALGAAGISSGDTVYLGAGVYREPSLTASLTSPAATTYIIGDVDGLKTGDAGEVRITPNVSNFLHSSATTLNCGARANLDFSNITWVCNSTGGFIASSGALTQYLTFNNCCFYVLGNVNPISFTVTVNQALHWTFNRCIVVHNSSTFCAITAPTTASADYDIDVKFNNCVGIGNHILASLTGSGASAGKPYGVKIFNCTTQGRLLSAGALHSTTNPSTVYNSIQIGASSGSVNANSAGMIVEDYNCLYGARTNVTAGTHSVTTYEALLHTGQENIWGGQPRQIFSLPQDSPLLSFGAQAGGPSTDFFNITRPSGVVLKFYGTATGGAAATLTDSGATWGTNTLSSHTLVITSGTGSGQSKSITSNTATEITVDGNWKTNPDNTSVYQVIWGDFSSTGKATSGSVTTLVDSAAAWVTNQWIGYTCNIDSGTSSGSNFLVLSNTATTLTFAAGTAPDNTSTYNLYKATSISTQDYSIGAFERGNNAQKETVITDVGNVGIRLVGAGYHTFEIPVSATSNTVTIRCYYDSLHGTGSKPQAVIESNGECGVVTETITAVGSAGAWETLSFTPFTPTVAGVVRLRVVSRSAASNGIAYFDTLTVT